MEKYNNELDFRRFIREVKRLKWVYIVSILFFGLAGMLYYMRSLPQYEAEGQMLIEDSSENTPTVAGGGVSAIMRSFSIGGFGSSSVDNEVKIMESEALRIRVIKKLGINRTYFKRKGLTKKELYDDSPIIVEAPEELFDTLSIAFVINVKMKNGKVDATAKAGRIFKKIYAQVKDSQLPIILDTPFGEFSIVKTPEFSNAEDFNIDVVVSGNKLISNQLKDQMYVTVYDAKSDVIALTYSSPNRTKALSVVDTFMEEYNKVRIERRHTIARQEIEYFTSRLEVARKNLDLSEIKLEQFVKENNFLGAGIVANHYAKESLELKEDEVKLQVKIDYYKDLINTLGKKNSYELIPMVDSTQISVIKAYNDEILKLRNLERAATPENSALKLATSNINEMRELIINNSKVFLEQAQTQMSTMRHLSGMAQGKISEMPELEREYTSLVRDNRFNNELFLFLLQKKESSDLKFYSNATLGFIFEDAYCGLKPSKTKAMFLWLLAVVLGVLLPTFLAAILLIRRKKIYEPMDLKSMGIEDHSVLYSGDARQIAVLRKELVDSGKRVFCVLDYSSSADIRDIIISSFKNIDKTVAWDNSLTDNDRLATDRFREEVNARLEKADYLFVSVPEKDNLLPFVSVIESGNYGILIIMDSGVISMSGLKKDIETVNPDSLYSLILK